MHVFKSQAGTVTTLSPEQVMFYTRMGTKKESFQQCHSVTVFRKQHDYRNLVFAS